MASPTTDRRQGLSGAVAFKAPVACATTANITLSGEQTIDGVVTSASRVLVKNQTNAVQNGIYDSSSAAWTRAIDANGNYDLVTGTAVYVTGGSSQGGAYYTITTTGSITVGTTSIVWALSVAAGNITAQLASSSVGLGSKLVAFIQRITGAVARWVEDKLAERVSVDDFGADPTGVADSTAAIKTAFQSGKTRIEAVGTYKVTSIDATITAHLTFLAHGAIFANTSQVAVNGVPILRIRGSASFDVSVLGLTITGPRLTGSTTVGSAASYASTGYPSGIDIYTARKAVIDDCSVFGTYYCGIEAHYCTEFRATKNTANIHGYAGILFSDCGTAIVDGNKVDDVGSTIITDGYGITSATSYNSPSAGYSDTVIITNNVTTKCKRKGIDAHSGLDITISNNRVKGFGNSGIYATCEGVDKQVRSFRALGNQVEGDTGFVASANNAAFDLGSFGAVLTQIPSFTVEGNEVSNLTAVYAFTCSVATNNIRQLAIIGNTVSNCSLTYGVSLGNAGPGVYEAVDVSNNDWIDCTLSSGLALMRIYSQLRFVGNSVVNLSGSNFISVDNPVTALVERNTANGVLIGAAQLEKYTDGLILETTQTFGGSVSNLNILSCDLGAANDNTVVVEVSATEIRNATTGLVTYTYNAYGTRTGAGAPAWTPAAATAMTVVTTVYGAATAPKLIWSVSGNVGTLQFQPQDTFAAYIVKVRATSWRGVLSPLIR